MRLSVTLLAARPMKSHRCDDGDDDDDAALDACAFAKGTKKNRISGPCQRMARLEKRRKCPKTTVPIR